MQRIPARTGTVKKTTFAVPPTPNFEHEPFPTWLNFGFFNIYWIFCAFHYLNTELAKKIDLLRGAAKDLRASRLVFNDFARGNVKREHKLAREDVNKKAAQNKWYVFENDIPHSDSYFRAARDGMPISSTKGTWHNVKGEFSAFAKEFFDRIAL